jgi:cytochrome b involved in lipid metabolism
MDENAKIGAVFFSKYLEESHIQSCESSSQLTDDSSEPDLSSEPPSLVSESTCDACPYCNDVCADKNCSSCLFKKSSNRDPGTSKRFPTIPEPLPPRVNCCDIDKFYTRCEVRRHNHIDSAWLIAGEYIYDATRYIKSHPAGSTCILLKSGGSSDVSQDMAFHSRLAMSMWRDCRIGKVKKCPCEKSNRHKKDVCIIS